MLKLKTTHDEAKPLHPNLIFSVDDGTTWDPRTFCGSSWCAGQCGMPALVLNWTDTKGYDTKGKTFEFKAHSSMVACGPVFQRFRVAWNGEKTDLPATAGDGDQLLKMMWW